MVPTKGRKRETDLDAAADAGDVQQVGDAQVADQVVGGERVEDAAVDARLQEGVLVLRQADVVQPPHHPLVVQPARLLQQLCDRQSLGLHVLGS